MEDGRPVVQSIDWNSQLKGRHKFEEPRVNASSESLRSFQSIPITEIQRIFAGSEEMNGLYNGKNVRVGISLSGGL